MATEAENKLKSIHSHTPVEVVFINKTQRFVDLFWVDFAGNLVRYKKGFKKNKPYPVNTYETHPWIARDSETCSPLLIRKEFVYIPKENEYAQEILITLPVYGLVDLCLDVLRLEGVHRNADNLEIPRSLVQDLKQSKKLPCKEYRENN